VKGLVLVTALLTAQVGMMPANPAYATRVLTNSTTTASTGANTTETDLWTYSMPANTLVADGKAVRIAVYGSTAANANVKTVRLYFGSTLLRTVFSAASNNETWYATAVVLRSGASAEVAVTYNIISGTVASTNTAPNEATASPIVIRVTGQNGTATAGDIVFRGAVVELLP
jgi:hypothetical protein